MTAIANLEEHIEDLRGLTKRQLDARWRAAYRSAPPKAFTRDLVIRGIAWAVQEKAFGGLSAEHRRLLHRVEPTSRQPKLRPGNRLVRRWRGRTYMVEVIEDGLTYDGKTYASLSEIAREITGTRWSGPRFFGLIK